MVPPGSPPPFAAPPTAIRGADLLPPPAIARPAEPKANRPVDPAVIEDIGTDLFQRMLQRGEVQPHDGGASWRRAQEVAAAIAPDMRPVPAAISKQLSPEQQRMRQIDIDFNRMLADGTELIYRRMQQDAEEARRHTTANDAAAAAHATSMLAANIRTRDATASLDHNPLPSHGNRPAPSWTSSAYSSSDSDIATWGPALFSRPAYPPKAAADQPMVLPGTSAHRRETERAAPSMASSSSTYRGPC